MISVLPVILCGGSGTRLWPLSRSGFPKQFLCLTGNESLYQETARRLVDFSSDGVSVSSPIIVTGEEHRFLASEQLREVGINVEALLLEPTSRNTAPALTLAALYALEKGGDPILIVTPADQTLTNSKAFYQSTRIAIQEANKGSVVILGITPNSPETGYGYIQIEENAKVGATTHVVRKFIEKPNQANALAYLKEGGHYWNAGIFILKASVWIKILDEFAPDILKATNVAWSKRASDSSFIRPGGEEFALIRAESVDYAAMEHCPGSATSIKMVKLDAGWSDLGAWEAVWKVLAKDKLGNAHIGDVFTTNSRNTMVHANSRLVGLVGVEDLIVVETPDAVLVANKSSSQDVKHIVNELKKNMRAERNYHRKVHRPWGWYDSIDEGSRFKVKRIQVNPKASLSLQKHHHRAEHWVVVSGTAKITIGKKVLTLTENQSTYIPLGEVHRLENPGTIPLEIIEVQSGSYLGEDDIVRINDSYGRA